MVVEMEKFFITVFCFLSLAVNQVFAASQGMKLYQNSTYNFSIEIPNYMSYFTPNNPNVKMSAGIQGFNMNVIVKSSPMKDSDDYFLNDLLDEQVAQYKNVGVPVLEYYVVNLPHYRVGYLADIVTYNYPEVSFQMTQYTFQFVRNWKYYCVSYFVTRGKEHLYQSTIKKSIDSLIVD